MYQKSMNIMGIRRRIVLNHSDKHGKVVLQVLTDAEEEQIDKSILKYGELTYLLDDKIKIRAKDIYLYGDINLENQEDVKLLEKFNKIICDEYAASNFIYSNVDYKKGIAYSDERGIYLGYTCMNWDKWFKYNYLLLGKPKKIIIYNISKNIIKNDYRWGIRDTKI